MQAFALIFADGRAFFVGLVFSLAALLQLHHGYAGWRRSLLLIMAVVGMFFVISSATPLPLWLYALWGAVLTTVLVMGHLTVVASHLRSIMSWSALLIMLVMLFMEVPYHRTPRFTVRKGQPIYVLGDSLSAGLTTRDRCWPEVLAAQMACPVVNLAEVGATTHNALAQARKITSTQVVVLVEIGGNDLLGGQPAEIFRVQLRALLAQLRSAGHTVLMLELPLYPFRNAYGRAQRELADQYTVTLIPKRFLTSVLGSAEGTQDGLHLSDKGHALLAEYMTAIISAER